MYLVNNIKIKGLYDMLKIIFYLQPQLLLLTIPMSLLLSTLLVYGRMDIDSEIISLKSSGMNFKKISLGQLSCQSSIIKKLGE